MDRKLRVLITDDSKLLRKKLRQELETLDCEVLEAQNGKEAVMLNLQENLLLPLVQIICPLHFRRPPPRTDHLR